MRNTVRHVGALVAVVGALSLAGCASPTAIEDFSGLPLVPVAAAEGAEEEGAEEAEPRSSRRSTSPRARPAWSTSTTATGWPW